MYKQILVPLDGSEASQNGLREAVALARSVKARLVLLHVVDDLAWLVDMAAAVTVKEAHDEVRRHGERLLSTSRRYAALRDVEASTVLIKSVGGGPAAAIVEQAESLGCDLVVMGTHGRKGLSRLVLGSDAMAVVQVSAVPVLLVSGTRRQPCSAQEPRCTIGVQATSADSRQLGFGLTAQAASCR